MCVCILKIFIKIVLIKMYLHTSILEILEYRIQNIHIYSKCPIFYMIEF